MDDDFTWQYQVQSRRNPDTEWRFCYTNKVNKDDWYSSAYGANYLKSIRQFSDSRRSDPAEYRIVRRKVSTEFEVV